MKIFLLTFLFLASAVAQLPANYQKLSVLKKQSILWAQIKQTPYAQLPATKTGLGMGFILGSLKSFSTLEVSFNKESDEMPKGRVKVIHPFGVTAPIEWVPVENKFSGVFSSGGLGFVRLSLAGDTDLLGFIPGMAIKILQENAPSVNLHVMNSLDSQEESTNFFERNFSNEIAEPTSLLLQPLVFLFSLVRNPPTYLPVNHFAEAGAAEVNAPYALIFEPTAETFEHMDANSEIDFRSALSLIPKGSLIYKVYAKKYEKSKKIHIGFIQLKDRFVASEYQDQKLFFQHNR